MNINEEIIKILNQFYEIKKNVEEIIKELEKMKDV